MFKLILKISWASLSKRKTRSMLVVLMIAMSLWGLLFIEGIYDGMTEQMISNAIRSSSGHITIYSKDYRLDNDISNLVSTSNTLNLFLKDEKRIKSHAMKLSQNCLIATAHQSQNAMLHGIDLSTELNHGQLKEYIVEGEYNFGQKNKGAIIGYRLAKKLKTQIGKKIIVSAQNSNNEVSSLALRVSGIIRTNNMALDEIAVFVSQEKVRSMLTVPSGVTQISILLHEEKDLTGVQRQLQKKFPHLDILRWDQIFPALLQSRVMMETFNLVISVLVFCIAGLGIFGVILVSVLERIREFGILLAIGTSFAQIRVMVLAESFFLGFLGFFAGTFLGTVTLFYFSIYGLDLTIFSEGLEAFGVDNFVYAIIKPSYIITSFCAVSLATLASVFFPLRILKRSKPIEAINKH